MNDSQFIMCNMDTIITVMVIIFMSTCMMLVFIASIVAFVFTFARMRESNELKESLIAQRKLDQAVERDLFSNLGTTSTNNSDGTG